MKKTFGFYVSALSAVLSVIGVALYSSVPSTSPVVVPLLIANAVLTVAVLALTALKGGFPGGNLLPVIGAVLCMGAVAMSFGPMATTVVFAFLGMSPMSAAQGYLVFVGAGVVAWLTSVIAAFPGIAKK